MDYKSISDWYDGYLISDWIPVEKRRQYREGKYEEHRVRVYSPFSVVKAVVELKYDIDADTAISPEPDVTFLCDLCHMNDKKEWYVYMRRIAGLAEALTNGGASRAYRRLSDQ